MTNYDIKQINDSFRYAIPELMDTLSKEDVSDYEELSDESILFFYDEILGHFHINNIKYNKDGYSVEKVDEYGGYEGAGEETWFILHFTTPYENFFIKFPGYYSSWDSTNWYDPVRVVPKPKEIIEWVDI
jgi:hypothetical protein